MSGHSDSSDSSDMIIDAEQAHGMAAVRHHSALLADFCCQFYDEAVAHELLFRSVDCRDDYVKKPATKTLAGRSGGTSGSKNRHTGCDHPVAPEPPQSPHKQSTTQLLHTLLIDIAN
jgi:hypothetical protein